MKYRGRQDTNIGGGEFRRWASLIGISHVSPIVHLEMESEFSGIVSLSPKHITLEMQLLQ
jgi:hypothetical protein